MSFTDIPMFRITWIYSFFLTGIEGFKQRTSAKLHGTKLLPMTLPIKPYLNPRKALGIMDDKKITVVQAVMMGNQLEEDFDCGL